MASTSGATLVARELSFSHGRTPVLEQISLVVAPGHRLGVVGANGVGKSTLLRILAGQLRPDRGTVTTQPPHAAVGYLPQEPERRAGETVIDFLVRRTGVAAASAELDVATAELGSSDPEAHERYDIALQHWLDLGGADLEQRSGEVWAELGLPERLLHQDMTTLSGGQAARVSLAATLLARFDVFLLDEPTNDLDFDGLARLEAFVTGLRAGALIVSHDRAFLQRCITGVIELDEHHRTASFYDGGWDAYEAERAVAREHAEEAYAGYSGTKAELEDRVRRQRQWADKGLATAKKRPPDNDRVRRGATIERTEKQASKVRISERALTRLDVVEKPWEGWQLHLEIARAPRSGDVVARLVGAVVERGGFTLGPVDLQIGWAERVAITGPNGAGKSTLLAALLGRVPLAAGERWLGPGVVVGEIDQARAQLAGAPGASLLDAFMAASGIAVLSEARSLLAKFGLTGGHVGRPSASVSPGERTRAVLALLMARGVNCLVLDEPTNHLDLPAIEQLEQALGTYDGTLLLVTHDRRLLETVHVDRRITVDGGRVTG